jgi:hypothetical protein
VVAVIETQDHGGLGLSRPRLRREGRDGQPTQSPVLLFKTLAGRRHIESEGRKLIMSEPSPEERRQALQDFEDLLYYWPGDQPFEQALQEVIAEGLVVQPDADHLAVTEKGHAYVERKRRLDANYAADLADFTWSNLPRRQ